MTEPLTGIKNKPLTFEYTFRFDDGNQKVICVEMDPGTLQQRRPAASSKLTEPDFCSCEGCPLRGKEQPACPAAASLDEPLSAFSGYRSDEPVAVTVETDARTYMKRTTLREGVTSLLGVYMVSSGCPVLGMLKPMVRYHLPFATLDETQYRALSMYLLAQHVRARRGQQPDWDMQQLITTYRNVHEVTKRVRSRIAHLDAADPSVNAVVILEALAYAIAFSLDRDLLDELKALFQFSRE
jgi:hypothetical protein